MRNVFVLAVALLALAENRAGAEERPSGTNSAQAREEAIRAIPYKRLDEDGRRKVDAVLANVTIFRRMPTQVTRCDPELYEFMIRRPDVTVNVWDVLGITKVTVTRTGETTFRANDGAGTQSDLQFLYSSHDTHLIYAVGSYEGTLFSGAVRGGCLLLLKTGHIREPDGHYYITSRLDAFFRIDHGGVDLVTRTFQPLVGRVADYNFTESLAFLGHLTRVAEARPATLQNLATRLDKVRPEDRRRFAEIVTQIAERSEPMADGNVPPVRDATAEDPLAPLRGRPAPKLRR